MPVSEARILSNRANSLKSTGPKTVEGKERSRRNGLKHGMTGQGVVVLEADAVEVERRSAALRAEMDPKSVIGEILVRQMATLSVRMERGALQEFASVAARVRNAADDFDEGRVERAEQLLEGIGDDPRGNLRRLRKSPEGVNLLVGAWRELRLDLTRELRPVWAAAHLVKAANLVGLRDEDARGSRIGILSRATWGSFEAMADHEGGGLADDARKGWARARLVERIDEEIDGLEAHLETLDFEAIEQDRAGAGDRALFDPSKGANLARRYESEARRGFFQAMKEFRRAESEAAERAESAPTTPASPEQDRPHDPLASSGDGPLPSPREPYPAPRKVASTPCRTIAPAVSMDSEVARLARGPA